MVNRYSASLASVSGKNDSIAAPISCDTCASSSAIVCGRSCAICIASVRGSVFAGRLNPEFRSLRLILSRIALACALPSAAESTLLINCIASPCPPPIPNSLANPSITLCTVSGFAGGNAAIAVEIRAIVASSRCRIAWLATSSPSVRNTKAARSAPFSSASPSGAASFAGSAMVHLSKGSTCFF